MQVLPKQDKETVRRLLEAALNRLDEETRAGEEKSNSILLSESGNEDTPVILVLIGGLSSSAQYGAASPVRSVDQAGRPATPKSTATAHDQSPAAHPGLERFPLAMTDSRPAAPKACFIEPGRACVSSGACELRGF